MILLLFSRIVIYKNYFKTLPNIFHLFFKYTNKYTNYYYLLTY